MAEGFARHKHAEIIEPSSVGLMPAAIIQPETYRVMSEKGVSLDGISPSPLRQVAVDQIDFVVNMCGLAITHQLKGFMGGTFVWNVPDPIGEPIEVYREVRDRIEELVDDLADRLGKAAAK